MSLWWLAAIGGGVPALLLLAFYVHAWRDDRKLERQRKAHEARLAAMTPEDRKVFLDRERRQGEMLLLAWWGSRSYSQSIRVDVYHHRGQ